MGYLYHICPDCKGFHSFHSRFSPCPPSSISNLDKRLRSSPLTQRMGERLCSSPVGREFAASPFWSSHLTYLSFQAC
nr:hypothetical protein Q903MT_gene1237 [Picea sitchensis]